MTGSTQTIKDAECYLRTFRLIAVGNRKPLKVSTEKKDMIKAKFEEN